MAGDAGCFDVATGRRGRPTVRGCRETPAGGGATGQGWLQLTGYAGDATAKARALRCRAFDTLTEAGKTRLPPGFVEADGMPPVPDKVRTGQFFGRRVMEFQNWTLASNARWRLNYEQLALLWQAEFPNARTR